MSARFRPPVLGAGAVLLLLSGGMETAAFRTSATRNIVDSHLRRRGDNNGLSLLKVYNVVDTTAGTTTRHNHQAISFQPQRPSRAGLWVMTDSRYGLALRTAHGEKVSSPTAKPHGGNILQRITTIASKRFPSPPATTPSPTTPPRSPTSPDSPSLHVLPSNPIERFSGNRTPGSKGPVLISRIRQSSSLVSSTLAEVAADMPSMSSLASGLISDLRSRSFLPPGHQQQHGRTATSNRSPQGQDNQPGGLRELSSAITRVESKLSLDSSEAGQLRVREGSLNGEKIQDDIL